MKSLFIIIVLSSLILPGCSLHHSYPIKIEAFGCRVVNNTKIISSTEDYVIIEASSSLLSEVGGCSYISWYEDYVIIDTPTSSILLYLLDSDTQDKIKCFKNSFESN